MTIPKSELGNRAENREMSGAKMKAITVEIDHAPAATHWYGSPDLVQALGGGKYSRWSADLTSGAVENLLKLTASLGEIFEKHLAAYGCLPQPDYSNCQPDPEPGFASSRVTSAIVHLARMRSGSNPKQATDESPRAFSTWFQDRLETGGLQWAVSLSCEEVCEWLWQIGEYSCRVGHHEQPDFDLAREELFLVKRALRTMVLIYAVSASHKRVDNFGMLS